MHPVSTVGGFNGFHHQTNPYSQTSAPGTQQAQGFAPAPFAVAAVPVYPVALMPAYMMAQGYGGVPGQAQSGTEGGHVVSNPTNALAQGGAQAAGGYGGFAAGGFAMPMYLSPVMFQLGFPVFAYPGAGGQTETPETPETVVDAPQTPPTVPEVDANPVPDPVVITDGPSVDVVPPSDPDPVVPDLPITTVSAAELAQYRLNAVSKSAESSLDLKLTTLDGDVITLEFNQMDVFETSRLRGKTLDGERVKDSSFKEDTERLVNMSVDGSLSEAEFAAIDEVLDAVITSVQSFFSGDTSAAIDRLKSMDFDTAQLGELALNMSMSKSVEMTRGYHNGSDRLHDLMEKDADVASALEFIASEQKRLIDVAGSVLDRPSSAKLVRSLLPPLMSEPFAALESKVNAARNPDETIEAQALLDALGTTTEEMVADASEFVKDVMPLDGQTDQ